jgi:hypothetical protein
VICRTPKLRNPDIIWARTGRENTKRGIAEPDQPVPFIKTATGGQSTLDEGDSHSHQYPTRWLCSFRV